MSALSAPRRGAASRMRRTVGTGAGAVATIDREVVAGLRRSDTTEVVGQVPRIVAAILFSRIWVPRGNTGRARVSALKPMPVPEDLRDLVG